MRSVEYILLMAIETKIKGFKEIKLFFFEAIISLFAEKGMFFASKNVW